MVKICNIKLHCSDIGCISAAMEYVYEGWVGVGARLNIAISDFNVVLATFFVPQFQQV
jgi:hypothetical protein